MVDEVKFLLEQQADRLPVLAELLPRMAKANRTVIVTSVNEAWGRPGSPLDLFRESFRSDEDIEHRLNHTLVVAVELRSRVPGAA